MKAKERDLKWEHLREVLRYDPLTGEWTWLKNFRSDRVGTSAGSRRSSGRLVIKIGEELFYANRLAWFYMTGRWPLNEVDHEDTDCTNDRWSNLRDIPGNKNAQNKRRAYRNNKSSGVLGVQRRPNGTFRADIRVDGKAIHLGTHSTSEAAEQAYKDAKVKHHATTSTHNKRRAFHG